MCPILLLRHIILHGLGYIYHINDVNVNMAGIYAPIDLYASIKLYCKKTAFLSLYPKIMFKCAWPELTVTIE